MRTLKAAGVAFVIPGIMFALIVENVHALGRALGSSQPFGLPVTATVNFLFWFGFGWLLATFISMLIRLRRAIGAAGVLRAGSSSPRSALK